MKDLVTGAEDIKTEMILDVVTMIIAESKEGTAVNEEDIIRMKLNL